MTSSCRLFAAALVGLVSLTGCGSMRSWAPTFVQPYRPDVQQGNVVTREMVEQLRESMTRDQVRFQLGTGDERQLRRLMVLFKNDRLASYESDEMPPEKMADNLILGRNPKAVPQAPPAKEPSGQVN